MSRRSRPTDGPGLDGILVVAKPAGPDLARRRRARPAAGGDPRVGHGGTLDPFATGVLPRVPRQGDPARRVPPRGPQALPGDGLLRGVVDDRRPRGRADAGRRARDRTGRPSRRRSAASAARSSSGRRPTRAIKVAGRRAYAMARAGETRRARAARGDDPRARPRRLGRRRRPAAGRDRRGRVLGRDVRPVARPRPRRGGRQRGLPRRPDPDRERAVRARRRASTSTRSGPPRPTARRPARPLLLPDRRRARACRRSSLPDARDRRDRPRPGRSACRAGAVQLARDAADPPASTAPGGSSRSPGSRRHEARPGQGPRRPAAPVSRPVGRADGPDGPTAGRGRRRRSPDARHGRLFVVVGVFDGLHLGHALPPRPRSCRAAARARRRPAVITFDAHPDEILARRTRRRSCATPASGWSGSPRPASRSASSSTSTTRCGRPPYDAFVARIADRCRAGRVPHDARRGVRPRAGAARRPPLAALGASDGFEVGRRAAVHARRATRSAASDIRAAIAAGDLAAAERLARAGPSRSSGDVDAVRPTDRSRCPVALPPAGRYGRWSNRPGRRRAGSDRRGDVGRGRRRPRRPAPGLGDRARSCAATGRARATFARPAAEPATIRRSKKEDDQKFVFGGPSAARAGTEAGDHDRVCHQGR